MYSIVSGQLAAFKQIDVIANNLANANTTGFKAEHPLFEKALAKQDSLFAGSLKKDISAPDTMQTESFVGIRGTYTDFTQGPVEITNNPLDAAINGKGFFAVQTSDGLRYTRAGNFKLDAQSRLITQAGDVVQGEGGDITVPNGALISISEDGSVLAGSKAVGKIQVVDIPPNSTTREAGQLFKLNTGANATPSTTATIKGGALEGSNVNAVKELADMILASRLYEGFQSVQSAESKLAEDQQHVGSTSG